MEKTEEVETKEKAKSGDSAVMGEQKGKGPKNSKESIFHSYLLNCWVTGGTVVCWTALFWHG